VVGHRIPDDAGARGPFFDLVTSHPQLIHNSRLVAACSAISAPRSNAFGQRDAGTGARGQHDHQRLLGYRSDDEKWKSAQQLIRNLSDIASKDGNYLLNVGPTAEGVIPQPEIDRLLASAAG